MGVFTDVVVGDLRGQVKIWNGHPEMLMSTVRVGDQVPPSPITGHLTYSITMAEGGYLHIEHGTVTGWKIEPLIMAPIFDKYGEMQDA